MTLIHGYFARAPGSILVSVVPILLCCATLLAARGARASGRRGAEFAIAVSTAIAALVVGAVSVASPPLERLVALAIGLAILVLLAGALRDAMAGALAPHAAAVLSLAVLALLAGAPVWLGPVVDRVVGPHGVDALAAVSPLQYLCALAHHDCLREPWFYLHTPVAASRSAWPDVIAATIVYALAAALLIRWNSKRFESHAKE
jgi:hypothetical protein